MSLPAEMKSYGKGYLRYLEPGNMVLSVYIKELDDLGVDIKFGDYVGYPDSESRIRFYTVSNDGKITGR